MQSSVSRVECLRQMMHITAFNKGVSHPDVLVISRKLDEAMNSLYKVDLVEKDCMSEQQSRGDAVDAKSLHMISTDKDKPVSTKKKTIKVEKQKKEAEIIFKGYNIRLRQQAILDFIRDYPHQYSPTIREIGAGVGLSSSTIHSHLIKLEEEGYIVRRPNCPRCIVLTESRL